MTETSSDGLPSGVVTFLLTDIESSARLWDDEPTAMGKAVLEHERLITRSVEGSRGVVLKHRGEGDSSFSVFRSASDAVRAAYALQLAIAECRWPTSRPIRLRAAIHTAEAVPLDGDYLGGEVNRVARLRAAAAPGEVLVSAASSTLLRSAMPTSLGLRDVGNLRLKGLAQDERVSALVGPGLPEPDRRSGGSDILEERGVTRRERDVFFAAAERLTNAEIAKRFVLSERTVESHISSLLRKLEVENRVELAELAREHAVLPGAAELPSVVTMTVGKSVCVGRGPERLQLLDAWRRAEQGACGVVLVTGEAGIGKSRLVADVAVQAHDRGARVLVGAATEDGGVPLRPFADALAGEVESAPEHLLRTEVGKGGADLARVLPGLAERLGISTTAVKTDDAGAVRLALVGYLTRLAARQPLLLVLEDLHWASPATRQVVTELARQAPAVPLLVVATARDVVPDLDDRLASWLATAERLPVIERLGLDGLDVRAAGELLAGLASDQPADVAHRRSNGNPLFLREIATAGAGGETMHDFVASRASELTADARELLDLAAVMGESFTATKLALGAAVETLSVIEAIEACAASGLVHRLHDGSLRFAFSHALVRDACYDALSTGRRLQLHADAARAFDEGDPDSLPELARHRAIAAPLGGADRAVELCRRAGERALGVGDLWDAASHFGRALDIVDLAQVDRRERTRLEILMGEALAEHDRPRSLAMLRAAAVSARSHDDPAAYAHAVCAMTSWGGSMTPGETDAAFVRFAEEALELLPETEARWRVRVLALLGSHLALGDEPIRGHALSREAVALARELGDPETFIRAVMSLRYSLTDFDRDEVFPLVVEAEAIAETEGFTALQITLCTALSTASMWQGATSEAERWLARAGELTDSPTPNMATLVVALAMLRGDLDEAASANEGTRELYPPELWMLYVDSANQVIGYLRTGTLVTDGLEVAAGLETMTGAIVRATLALGALRRGDADSAYEWLAAERERGLASVAEHPFQSGTLAMWGEVVSELDIDGAARELFDLLVPLEGHLATISVCCLCSIDLIRGRLALALGDVARAIEILDRAVAASRARGSLIFLGRELVAGAAARRRAGASQAEVDALLDEARSIATQTGAGIIDVDLQRLLGSRR